METTPTTDIRYQQARKRVEEIKGFYTHLVIYLVVNAFLFAIDLIGGGNWWFYWPLLGGHRGRDPRRGYLRRGGPVRQALGRAQTPRVDGG